MAKVGDLVKCPVSGAIFEVKEDSKQLCSRSITSDVESC
jgi:hypothetical protein